MSGEFELAANFVAPKTPNIQEDVERAREKFSTYLDDQVALYNLKTGDRAAKGVPALAFCGYGRSGKDFAAEWLSCNYQIDYVGSISFVVAPLIAHVKGISTDEAFARRHEDRDYWFKFCNLLRKDDPTLLVKLTLARNDVVAGVRSDYELDAIVEQGVVDLSIWVDRPGTPIDQTVTYEAEDCHITISNAAGKMAYMQKLRSLARMLKLPEKSK